MDGTSAVPLFLPSNCEWNQLTRQAEINVREHRGDLRVCQEGLSLIKSIQDEFVVVVCITGPARTGKSYFLSQLQDGISFEVGHSTTSKTTGVWIALSPGPIQVEGKSARLVLMDAEGLGSTSTVDHHGQDEKWENRVFSLCALLSSFLIYNSRGIPNNDDLDKLGFIAQFSAAIHSSQPHTEKDGAGKITRNFRRMAPHFLWLVRDALLKPEINGVPCDWKMYVEKVVLSVKEGKAGCRRNSVCQAITGTFKSFNAFGLPPPSIDPDVIQSLSLPESREKINPHFITGIQEVKNILSSSYCLKTIHDCFITGLQMAESLPSMVAAVNKECGKLHVESMWDSVVKSQLTKGVEQALDAYNEKMSNVRLPAPTHYINSVHGNAVKKARNLFHEQSRHFDHEITKKFNEKLSTKLEKSLMELAETNNIESRKLCENKMKELFDRYFSPLEENTEERAFTDFLQAKENIFKIYNRRAKGPLANDVRKAAEDRLRGKMKILGQIILQTTTSQVHETYKNEMNDTKEELPLEEDQLRKIHDEAYNKCQDLFKTKCDGCDGFERCKSNLESDFCTWFESYRERNFQRSLEVCEELMKRLECRHLDPVITMATKCKYSDLMEAKGRILTEYEVDAKGPAKDIIREKCEEKINQRLRSAEQTVVEAALGDAEREYKSLLEKSSRQGPYDIHILQSIFDREFEKVRSMFHDRCAGVNELSYQISEQSLLDVKEEQNQLYKVENDEKSRKMCEDLMKQLIAQHITPQLNDVDMFVNFQEKKERIMEGYEKKGRGPKKDEVKEQFDPQIDEDIKRGEQLRILKGVKITLEAASVGGIAMAPLGGKAAKMGAAMSAATLGISKMMKK